MFWKFEFRLFGFVSNFGFRASNLIIVPDVFTNTNPESLPQQPEVTKTPEVTPAAGTSFVQHLLSAFMVRPDGIKFETQEDQEKIILFMRQHPIKTVGWIFASLVLVFTPVIFMPVLLRFNVLLQLPPGYYVILPILWYLGTFGFTFSNFLYWYYNVYIVTNERIIDVDWYNLLFKQVASAKLEKIQDVKYKQGGILDSFFNFGNVFIQTAGTEPNFEFESIPKPDQVVKLIEEVLEDRSTKNIGA